MLGNDQMKNKTKILTVCRHGNIRSIAMARILKKEGYDAIPIGITEAQPDTLEMLAKWADKILFADSKFMQFLPQQYKDKFMDMELGEDIWKDANHPDLLQKIERKYYALKSQLY